MQSYVNNAMKITEKLGLDKKKEEELAAASTLAHAKETLTLSGSLT